MQRSGRSLRVLLACLALLAGSFATLAAQGLARDAERRTLTGVVVDAGSGAPIAGAMVAAPLDRRTAFTDAEGRFALPRIREGAQGLLVTQLGYDTLTVPLEVTASPEPLRLELRANPVLLEGIRVVADRFKQRRNAVATSVWAFEGNRLRNSSARDALEFVQQSAGITPTSCVSRMSFAPCAYVRGRPTQVVVYVDDAPMVAGLDVLQMYRPDELYLVEVFSGGRHIRIYTDWFVERAARTRRLPVPFIF